MRTPRLWLGLGLASLSSVVGGSEIRTLKPLYPETVLVAEGRATCVIVAPDTAALRPAATALADGIAAVGGARPEILSDTAVVSRWLAIDHAALGNRQIVALGNINSNRLLAALWGQDYTAEDDVFPGAGGYVVRTVHDPFARGVNVVVLAGSEVGALQRAVDTLLKAHVRADGKRVLVPGPVVEVRTSEARRGAEATGRAAHRLQFPSPAAFGASLDRRVRAQISRAQDEAQATKPSVVNLTHVLGELARAWFYTGDAGYPPLMKRLVDEHRALLNVIPPRVEMEGATADDMRWWDLVEELPIWTERDRLELANAFLKDALQGHEPTPAHRLVKEGYVQVKTENHGTNSALHTYDHWRYFGKYYDLPEEAYWLSVVRAIFAGQLASHQLLEDSATYLPFSHEDDFAYAMASGDMRYLQLGIARTHMEFVIQCCYSNLGLSSGFGDVHFLQFPWGFTAAARIGWMLKDPRVAWWHREYLPRQCGVDTVSEAIPIDASLAGKEPREWTGLSVFPIYRQALGHEDESKIFVTTPAEPAGPEWFNKIVFREAWSPNAQYLLLDGAGLWRANNVEPPGPTGHNQDDINTIITLTDKGRLWLVDHTYAERAIQQHSGLTIACDGETSYTARPARLVNHAQGASFGITRSVSDDFSGAQWERTIFWRRGDHFVVLDRAIAQRPGTYAARCNFRALGEYELRGAEMRLTQQGRFFQIRSDGGSRQSVDTFQFPESDWRRAYPHAEPVAKILAEFKSARLETGEAISFANLLKASDRKEELDATELKRCDNERLIVRAGGAEFIYGLASLPGGMGEGDAFALSGDTLLAAGVRRIGSDSEPILSAGAGIDVAWEQGELRLHLTQPAEVTIAGQRRHFAAGDHTVTEPALVPKFAALLSSCRAAAVSEAQAYRPANGEERKLAAAPIFAARRVALGTRVNRVVAADLDGSGRLAWCTAGPEGLSAYTPDGKLRWRFAPGKACAALDAADLDGDGKAEIVVGCADEKVYLVDGAGKMRWSFSCKPTERTLPPVPDRIQIVDLDGDGKKEIVVGANFLHCLAADGSLRWEDYWMFQRGRRVGDVQSFAVADFNHDGRNEVVAAIDLNYPVVVGYDAGGSRVYAADKTKQRNHKFMRVHPPQDTAVLDLFADGGDEQIVVAAKDQLNLRWTGGERDTHSAGDLSGGRVALAWTKPASGRPLLYTATDMGAVLAYRARGTRADGEKIDLPAVWRQTVGDKISALWAGELGGRTVTAVGVDGGVCYVFDGVTGAVIGRAAEPDDPVRQIQASSGKLLVIHASGVIAEIEFHP